MSKRSYKRRKNNTESDESKLVTGLLTMAFGYFIFSYFTDKEQFWYQITYFVLPSIVLIGILVSLYIAYFKKGLKKGQERVDTLFTKVKESGFEIAINNFIDRFGKEGKKESWKYRGYSFDWSRLQDFRETVIQSGIEVSTEDYQDLILILKHYIDAKEKAFLNNGINTNARFKFSELNKTGSDFEQLIVRLYNSTGYVSKRIGGSGDQGADVIASKNGDNILIQAKCYTNAVSNDAVQQASAALAFHGCNKAVVITTSFFTPGALALAKANRVELIDKEMLKRLLLENLGETWL